MLTKITKTVLTMLSAILLSGLLGGCAPKNWDVEEDGAYDELEPINREIFKINKGLDWLILKPVARSYDYVTPTPVQNAVGNFFGNLAEPTNVVNNAFQRQGDATFNSAARFVFNTTIGLGGIFDIADSMGIKEQKADFGQTLRSYGLADTTYIVLPLLGPSSFADGLGVAVDGTTFPPTYMSNEQAQRIVYGVDGVHKRGQYLGATNFVEGVAVDDYSFIRDVYEQRRQTKIPSEVWNF